MSFCRAPEPENARTSQVPRQSIRGASSPSLRFMVSRRPRRRGRVQRFAQSSGVIATSTRVASNKVVFIYTLMGAEADAVCGAGYGQRSAECTNQRNGYRHRQFDTRAGTLDLAIPKLRQGSYFLDWLLERRKRAERALTTVVATRYLLSVSSRRMDKSGTTSRSTRQCHACMTYLLPSTTILPHGFSLYGSNSPKPVSASRRN